MRVLPNYGLPPAAGGERSRWTQNVRARPSRLSPSRYKELRIQ
jgi:hypothetical protein